MTARRTFIGILAVVLGPALLPAHGARAGTSCVNLPLHAKTKLAWIAAYKKARHLEGLHFSTKAIHGPDASYYGRCGGTYYGRSDFALVKGQHLTERQEVGLQDGPDIFRRRAGPHRWRDVGDTGGGTPCGGRFGVPAALVHLWGKTCGEL